jgi:hypothetical protein
MPFIINKNFKNAVTLAKINTNTSLSPAVWAVHPVNLTSLMMAQWNRSFIELSNNIDGATEKVYKFHAPVIYY